MHDAIYDPRALGDANEQDSAEFAAGLLTTLGVPEEVASEVARLVGLTAGHATGENDPDGELLCDADLAILASDEPGYARYTAAIRREYAHVSDDDFRAGRAQGCEALLELPAITPRAAAGRVGAKRGRTWSASSTVEVLGPPQPRGPQPRGDLAGRQQGGAEPQGAAEPSLRDVVVVPVEGPARCPQHLGEHVQLVVGEIADQVRPEAAAGGPERLVDEDQRSTSWRSAPRSAAKPRTSGTPSRAASAVRSSGIGCDSRSAATRAR